MTSREFYLHRLRIEYPVTQKVLEAIPEDKFDYKPDERSSSAGQLAWLLTYEMQACFQVLTEARADWKNLPPPPRAELLKQFEANARKLAAQVEKSGDAEWDRKAGFYYEGQLVTEHPAGVFIWLSLFDAIHHRGQLTAYLRPMGGKVPAIYGPSADDQQGHGAWQ